MCKTLLTCYFILVCTRCSHSNSMAYSTLNQGHVGAVPISGELQSLLQFCLTKLLSHTCAVNGIQLLLIRFFAFDCGSHVTLRKGVQIVTCIKTICLLVVLYLRSSGSRGAFIVCSCINTAKQQLRVVSAIFLGRYYLRFGPHFVVLDPHTIKALKISTALEPLYAAHTSACQFLCSCVCGD